MHLVKCVKMDVLLFLVYLVDNLNHSLSDVDEQRILFPIDGSSAPIFLSVLVNVLLVPFRRLDACKQRLPSVAIHCQVFPANVGFTVRLRSYVMTGWPACQGYN